MNLVILVQLLEVRFPFFRDLLLIRFKFGICWLLRILDLLSKLDVVWLLGTYLGI